MTAASKRVADARTGALVLAFVDPDSARRHAAQVKQHVLDNLKDLLLEFESRCLDNGIRVHWASNAESAREKILAICRSVVPEGACIVKSKSMATEEIHLNPALIGAGYEVVETDLGEYIVQIDGDSPSHIVAPIIHKNRREVAVSFEREGLGAYTEDPEELAGQARSHLRSKFKQAAIGISGVNFAIAESGRIVIVENEGNNRLCCTSPKVHIALMGIEKLLPREADLPLFLRLLAGSATGQALTVYTHLVHRPRRPEETDGPDEIHLVLLDNGRTSVLNSEFREILRCIRCGACLNTCPVYRASSGHAYGHVYSGPLGAVLAPALEGIQARGALAMASTLCGACEEVCPVQIPIPRMLLQIRQKYKAQKGSSLPSDALATLAANDRLWRCSLKLLPMAKLVPNGWTKSRELPKRRGRSFRRWFSDRT